MWEQVLAEQGIQVEAVDSAHVRLRHDGASGVYRVVRLGYQPAPSQLPSVSEPVLLVVPHASTSAIDAARARGWAVVTDRGVAVLPGQRPRRPDPEIPDARRPGPVPWALFSAVRALAAHHLPTQGELAKLIGVGQPRVSKILARLHAEGLVRAPGSLRLADIDTVCDWWLGTYPGPGGVSTYWYSLAEPAEQARAAVERASERVGLKHVRLSGDTALDLVAPWRRPGRTVLYVQRPVDLGSASFVPATGPGDATLRLVLPADPGIWLPRVWNEVDVPIADGLQLLFDVAHGPDADQAVAQLRRVLRRAVGQVAQR